jgi:hypothetical protein
MVGPLFSTPNPIKVKGQTLTAEARQEGTDTLALWTRAGFCVTMEKKLRNVPSKSLFQGIDEALLAIKLLQHGLTHPLNPDSEP